MGKAQQRIAEIEANIKKSKIDSNLVKDVSEWKSQIAFEKDLVEFYTFKIAVYDEGKRGMFKFKDFAKNRLIQTKDAFKLQAGTILNKRLKSIVDELSGILDNNELLRYEVFAASGENNTISSRERRRRARRDPNSSSQNYCWKNRSCGSPGAGSMKPKSKELQWAFDGEYWEDEIGNYPIKLKNNCPKGNASAMNR